MNMISPLKEKVPHENVIGYIPVVGSVLGGLRIGYGAVKVVAGAVGGVACVVFTGSDKGCGKIMASGALHIGRGSVELVPLSCVVTYPYDNAVRASFRAARL